MISTLTYHLHDYVVMKKPHPCSTRSTHFQIVRVGADIKIKCLGCQLQLMMTRDHFNQRVKTILGQTLPSSIY
jgi:hypothetical protein